MRWLVILSVLLFLSAGCNLRGCICHETAIVSRSVDKSGSDGDRKAFQLGHQQTGEGAVIEMKIPADMNASLCVC